MRFLRALQEGEITRVGATESIHVDVRLVAATNRSLTQEVSEGRFREDLFYRLAVAAITLLASPDIGPVKDPILAQDVRQGIDITDLIDKVVRHCLEQAIQITGNNKARAAKLLGFGNPTTLTNWLKKHGVEP